VEEIHSDPGSDLKSSLVTYLNKYLGMEHVFSLVDRHESNGVERVIQEVLRHLRALVYEERLIGSWSKPIYRAAIKHIMNNAPLSERGGFSANQLTYGTVDHDMLDRRTMISLLQLPISLSSYTSALRWRRTS
jgi:hypothetical protein